MRLGLRHGFQLFLLTVSLGFLYTVYIEDERSRHVRLSLGRGTDEVIGFNPDIPQCLQRSTLLNSTSPIFDKTAALQHDAQCTQLNADVFTQSIQSAASDYLESEQCIALRGSIAPHIPLGKGRRRRCSRSPESQVFKEEVGGGLVVSVKYKAIYVPNMKVASQLFRTTVENRLGGRMMNQNSLRKLLTKHNHSLEDYFVFTFVRNPLSHFVSAYAEVDKRASSALERADIAPRGFLKLDRNLSNEPTRALEALQDIQSGRFKGLTPAHLYTQFWKVSRCLARSKVPLIPNFIGKIENLSKDWRVIERKLGVSHEPLKKVHAGTNPAKTHAKQLDLVSEQNRPLLQELCSFYYEDFVCFGYKLPPDCQEPGSFENATTR